jgi:tetratricopeptide (TPR) repeat protein/glycosyltransferase involved in cell wall biosynthesis
MCFDETPVDSHSPELMPEIEAVSPSQQPSKNSSTQWSMQLAEAFQQLATDLLQHGQVKMALDYCRLSIQAHPTAKGYKLWGDGLQQLGQFSQAEKIYKKALELEPETAEIYANLGSLYAQQQQWLNALSCYRRAIALKPNLDEIQHHIRHIWFYVRKSDVEIDAIYKKFLTKSQNIIGYDYLQLGQILQERGRLNQAVVCYHQALKLNPNWVEAQQQLQLVKTNANAQENVASNEVQSSSTSIQPQSATELCRSGDACRQQQQWNKAISYYEQAILLDSELAQAHWGLARALERVGKLDVATDCYFRALTLQPSLASSIELCRFGQLFLQQERLEQALACYRWAVQQDDNCAEAHFQIGEVLCRQEQYEAATTSYRQAVKSQPSRQGYHHLGDALLKMQQWEAAAEAYTQAIQLDPTFSWSHNNLGDALMHLQQWEAAVRAYQRAIELNPEFPWSHYNLGEALTKLQRWDEAIRSYNRVLALQPEEEWVQSRVGASHFNDGIQRVIEGRIEDANLCFSKVGQIGDAEGDLIQWPQQQGKFWPFCSFDHLQSIFETLKPQDVPWPKITIVTPSLNQGVYIEETILSILNQNYENLEYIIVDGGSTDTTLSVLERYRTQVTHILIEPDHGQANALNKGFRIGSGELMTWINSDDLLSPGALHIAALSYLQRNWDVMAGICVMHRDHKILTVRKPRTKPQNFVVEHLADLARLWATGHFFFQPEVIFTRQIWEQAGAALDESLNYAMDYDLWMRFAQIGAQLQVVSWPLAFFRNHSSQKTADQISSVNELLQVTERYHTIAPSPERTQAICSALEGFLALSRRKVLIWHQADEVAKNLNALQSIEWGNYHLTFCTNFHQINLENFDAVLLIIGLQQGTAMIESLEQKDFTGLRLAWFQDHQHQFDHNAMVADRVDICIPSQSLLSKTLRSYFSVLSSEVPLDPTSIAPETIHQFIPAVERIWHCLEQLLQDLKQKSRLPETNKAVGASHSNTAALPFKAPNNRISCPTHSSVYTKLGDAYTATQNLEAAIAAYNTALKFNPETVDIRAKLNEATVVCKMTAKAQESQLDRPWPYSRDSHPVPPTLPNGGPWPKISIITPSFNQGEFIEETILSVIHQYYPNVEHILIDGDSTDNTMQVVDRYRKHFAYVVSEPDKGQSNALNKGFQQASGDILTWLNSDDRLAPGALYAMALAFYTSGADMVAGVCQLFRDNVEVEQHLTSCVDGVLPLDDLLDLDRCWLKGKFFYQPEVMFTRSLWKRAGGYVDESLFYSMDYELWTRFATQGARLSVIGYPIAQYRMHAAQKTSDVDKYEPELRQVCDSLRLRFNYPVSHHVPRSGPSRLRIALVNDVGTLGGAGIAHSRIGQALALAGHEVISIAGTLDWSLTPVSCMAENVFQLVAEVNPDLVVVGNLHNMEQPLDVLELLSSHFYTIFVMHDQWLLTGRCAYVGACEKYMMTCDAACPTSSEYPRLAPDKIKHAFDRKHALLRDCNRLLVLGDSHWTTNWARYAFFNCQPRQAVVELDHKFQMIRYGLDLKTFYPRDRRECRRQLGLPEDKFIILTGSQSIEDERKGFRSLVAALKIAALGNAMVVSFGYGASMVEGIEIHSAGYVSHPLLLACYYSAADLFVGPSQEEAFGQTFIEAAACGTPAVGYELGGIKEAITDKITGRVATKRTPEALAEVILELYGDEQQRQLLSTLAPIYIANCFSFQSSYHSFMVALEQSGWLNLLQLSPASKFLAHLPELAQPTVVIGESRRTQHGVISGSGITGHTLAGFSDLEPPYPQLELENPSQWLLWPEGEFVVLSSKSQRGQLLIHCRNISPQQCLEIWQNEQLGLQEQNLHSNIKQKNVLSFSVLLEQGINKFTLKVSCYQIDESQRKLGVLIEKIEFIIV